MLEIEVIFASLGQSDALNLRNRANGMDGTAIIEEEIKIPEFRNIDYTSCPAGTPVKSEGQVYKLIQPYNAIAHAGLPKDARDRWALCHTKNPKKAKAWVDPLGVSGMYELDECYQDENGKVWRCIVEKTNFPAAELASAWESVEELSA